MKPAQPVPELSNMTIPPSPFSPSSLSAAPPSKYYSQQQEQREEEEKKTLFFLLFSSSPTMSSFFGNFQKKRFFPTTPLKDDLPISQEHQKDAPVGGLRRRISSFSIKIQPLSSASSAWAFRRSKSMPSIGEFAGGPLRRWWDWGWGWILSRKPTFARDLEMNGEETAMLGCHSKGTWRHVFYKVRSEFRKLVGSNTLPTTQKFRYDSCSYVNNFDDGKRGEQ